MKKTLYAAAAALLCAAVLLFSLASCGDDGGEEGGDKFRVVLTTGDGYTVTGSNPLEVESGGSAVFNVSLENGYIFTGVSDGEYNEETGVLTIADVTRNLSVTFSVEKVDYDTKKEIEYEFYGATSDTSSLENGTYLSGREVTVTAGDETRLFVGWSTDPAGLDIISEEREFTFRFGKYLDDGQTKLRLYPNYTDNNKYTYDANGGHIKDSEDTTLTVTLDEEYLEFAESVSTMYDNGTFVRDGYVLIEYNTKPDGSGDVYSIGSKVYLSPNEPLTLYCIWAEETPEGAFTYQSVSYPKPSGVLGAWESEGVIITKYTGSDPTVVIPLYIDDKPVLGIKAGAFDNLGMKTLVLSRNLKYVESGAFTDCTSLTTLYFSDSIFSIPDDAFNGVAGESGTYKNFRHFYVNATMAPRDQKGYGAFAVKLSRLLAAEGEKKIIAIGGSSSFQGLSTPYMEALFENEYTVIEFGTTRATNAILYVEAMQHYAEEGDIVLYIPENSAFQAGSTEFCGKLVRDLEGMNNLYRYIDISNYTGMFSTFTAYNSASVAFEGNSIGRYMRPAVTYEDIVNNTIDMNMYGDVGSANDRDGYQGKNNHRYTDTYYITLNNRIKSVDEGQWSDSSQTEHQDYTDLSDPYWCNMEDYADQMNRAISAVRETGAKVYFGFCPVDEDKLVDAARDLSWRQDYDTFIAELYDVDGVLGTCTDYVYAHEYFYDCAFHTNDYGRAIRTYELYTDICEALGVTDVNGMKDFGTDFAGCLFEEGTTPLYPLEIER